MLIYRADSCVEKTHLKYSTLYFAFAKRSVLFLSTKNLKLSYIFSLMAKSDMKGACVMFWKSQSYSIFALTSLEERNITLRKQNITPKAKLAERQI